MKPSSSLLAPARSRYSVSTVASDDSFESRFSIPEIQVAAEASFRLDEKLVVKRGHTPVTVVFQRRNGHTNIWSLNPPIIVDQDDDFFLKLVIHQKPRFIVASDRVTVYVASMELMSAYAQGALDLKVQGKENIEVTIKLVRAERSMSIDFVNGLPSWKLFEQGETFSEGSDCIIPEEPPDQIPTAPDAELPSTAEKILRICPRFRILVIGKSGVGKSSLINRTFGVSQASVSEDRPGEANIDFEITSNENDKIVVHDSKGFEQGDTKNLDVVRSFIKERGQMPHMKDQLHAIWLCTEIPSAGGRVFEIGDEMFLRNDPGAEPFHHKVPVIVVFTKYDQLVRDKDCDPDNDDLPDETREQIVEEQAEKSFRDDCVQALRGISLRTPYVKVSKEPRYRHLLQELVETTFEIVRDRVSDLASYMVAMSQRINSDVKIDSCIDIGRKRYWRALASTADFPGKTLKTCLDVLHKDIVLIWNFDDNTHLMSDEVKGDMIQLLADMRDKDPSSPMKSLTAIGPAVTAIASATAAVPIAAPIVIPIAVIFGIAAWVYQLYQRSHETIRCLMCYIVDLTLIMRRVFELQVQLNQQELDYQDRHQYGNGGLTPPRERISPKVKVDSISFNDVLARYGRSEGKRRNHTAIRTFVEELNIQDRFSSRKILNKIEELIRQNDTEPGGSPHLL